MHTAYGRAVRFVGTLFGVFASLMVGAHGPTNTEGDSAAQLQRTVPKGVILVKGAWPSASDSVTPLPEDGRVTNSAYVNSYFGLTYALPADWKQTYDGPPPSDSGYYVLPQLGPADTHKGAGRGTILIAAQNLFFTPTHAGSARELINFAKNNLKADYQVEQPVTEVSIGNRSFVRFGYASHAAGLHWSVLATEIRCHTVQFIITSPDPRLIATLTQAMNYLKLPAETGAAGMGGDAVPVCVKGYASGDSVLRRVDAMLTERRFNPIPVRVIIDKQGKVKHIHFLSAFPAQAKSITDALMQWRFKPYVLNGRAVEVETGIMFGQTPRGAGAAAN